MLLLQATKLTHAFGTKDILKDVSLDIRRGDRIGLVGPNGEGKSTLIRILNESLQPEQGSVRKLANIAYVPQSLEDAGSQTPREWLQEQGGSLREGWAQELGLQPHIWNLPLASLSGGEQTKVALLSAFSHNPDCLLLDEPTNHLDLHTVEWLEKWLNQSDISFVVISHDRRFLDQVTSSTWELKQGVLREFPFSYSEFAAFQQAEQEQIEHNYASYLKEKERLKESILRKQMWADKGEKGRKAKDPFAKNMKTADSKSAAKMAGAVKAMERRLEKLEPEEKPEYRLSVNARFIEVEQAARPVLVRAEGVCFSYEGRHLLHDVQFEIERGDRIALVGRNGIGKSTLLKLITGQLTPDQGSLRQTPTARLGHFDQLFANLNPNSTLVDELLKVPDLDKATARLMLGAFLFKRDEVFRKVSSLSFGERVRFVFARLVVERNNLLILDEPSNHLDIATREKIEEALIDYTGSFVCASHDRYFLEKMTNKVWEIEDGKLHVHPYGFAEYRKQQNARKRKTKNKSKNSLPQQDTQEIQEELLRIETRLAQLSWELSQATDPTVKQALDEEFIQLSRQKNQLRSQIS